LTSNLRALQLKQHKEIGKAIGPPHRSRPAGPRLHQDARSPSRLRYNKSTTRLIEPMSPSSSTETSGSA